MKIELTPDEAALIASGIRELIIRSFDELNARPVALNIWACLSVLKKMEAEAFQAITDKT